MKKQPVRMCAICREKRNKIELIRIVNNPEEGVCADYSGRMNGRGAYVCNNADCISHKNAMKILSNALKTEITDEAFDKIRKRIMNDIDKNK